MDTYGAFLRGADSPCLGLLGMAQIDKAGNINTTRVADGTYITGSSGANDCTAGSAEVMVTSFMSRRRFVAGEVDYISAPGDRVTTVVTDRCILEKLGGDELVLTAYFPAEGVSEAVSGAPFSFCARFVQHRRPPPLIRGDLVDRECYHPRHRGTGEPAWGISARSAPGGSVPAHARKAWSRPAPGRPRRRPLRYPVADGRAAARHHR